MLNPKHVNINFTVTRRSFITRTFHPRTGDVGRS